MNIKLGLLAAAMMIAIIPVTTTAKEYYVSVSGSDKSEGSLKSPFKTIAKATSVMEAGDECVIMEGTYREVLKSRVGGSKKKPITYRNYKDDKVVVDATEPVTGWVKHSGQIYKVKKRMPASKAVYNTLFYNGELLDIARWPNNTDGDKFSFEGHRVDAGGSASHFVVKGMPDFYLNGAYFCYLGAHSGTSWSRLITKHEGELIYHEGVDIKKWPYNPHNPTVKRNKNFGQLYLFGALDLLDHPGEWFYDTLNQTIYAMFPDGAAPKDGAVTMGVRRTTVELNHDNIIIDGVDVFGGEVRVNGNFCTVSNSVLSNCSQTYEGLIGISAQSNTATMMITGSHFTMENILIEYGMASGVVISPRRGAENPTNYTINNNVIRYFNSIGIHANAIRSRGEKTIITNNTIYTCGRDGVSTSGKYTEIAYNEVFDCMRINNDGGVYYTVGNKDLRHTKIHHNYFHNSYGPAYADGRAAGVYLDNNSKGFDVYNNVLWNVTWSALMINWYNTDINFYNNTIWDCGFNMGRWENGYTMERIRVFNNYANVTSRDVLEKKGDQKAWIGTEFGSNLIFSECPFVAVDKRDFSPKAGSELIGAGVPLKGFAEGKKGSNPDVGAYKQGEKLWSVGASWADEVFPKDFVYGLGRAEE